MDRCRRAVGLLVYFANRTSQVAEEVEGIDGSIQFEIEGEKPFNVGISNGRLTFSNGELQDPDATLKAKSETFFKVMTREVDPEEAFSAGKYSVEGSIIDVIRFRRIGDVTMQAHSSIFRMLSTLAKLA